MLSKFQTSDSWVILSPIETSIKAKIEAVGTPLKDWNLSINYGIKTGLNEAFIISTEKRDEILSNCRDEDERRRTAELIRPILRGRDIRRYGYEWANLWLINAHNGVPGKYKRIEIENYPAIKQHLDEYHDELFKRADQGDTPYNLRNCAYLDDFNKPKIIWKIIGNRMGFAIEKNGYIVNNACYILTGENLDYLLGFFNSNAILWYSNITNMNKTGVGDVQVGAQNVLLFPVPKKSFVKTQIENLISNPIAKEVTDQPIEDCVCEAYGFTKDEKEFLTLFSRTIYG